MNHSARNGFATKDSPQAIVASQLTKSYAGRRVVDGISFEVRRGEVVGLLGPNGAGKTTSFYMVMGLVQPDSGQVQLGSKNIAGWPMHRRSPPCPRSRPGTPC